MTVRKVVGWLVFAALVLLIVLHVAASSFYAAGVKFYSSGKYQAAANCFRTTVFFRPTFARGYVELGSSYLALKRFQQAEAAFLKARGIEDESCASCGLGMTYQRLGRHDDAEKEFKRAMSLNPNDSCAYQQSGWMYYEMGKYPEAIAAFKREISLNPNYWAYVYLGNVYVYAREFESGVDAYKTAVRFKPNEPTAHVQLGVAYEYLNRYEEAISEYKQATVLDPNDEKAHYGLAMAYQATNNKPAALEQFEILRRLNPGKASEFSEDSALPQGREKGKEKLYFIPLGNFSGAPITRLVSYYKHKLGIAAVSMPAVSLALPVVDKRRSQLIAEEVIELMKRKNPQLAEDPNVILIGLTDEDMYIRQKNWQYAFSYRTQRRFAVVSNARMNPVNLGDVPNQDLLDIRMRKMVTKNIGLLYYLLPANHNPKSVLYSDVLSVEDLDRMGEEF